MHSRTDHIAKALVILALSAFLGIWALTTPLAGYPDELDHYVRALAVGRGEFVGEPEPRLDEVPAPDDRTCCDPGNPNSVRWVYQGTRIVDIPARLAPEHIDCAASLVNIPWLCAAEAPEEGSMPHATAMGTIEPLPYVLPGLATRLTSDPDTAYRLARLTSATVSAGLLAIAVLALWPRRRDPAAPALAGVVVAITPMVLFVGSSASPSALEVSAGVAFFAVLLRLARDDDAGWPWLGLAVAGACLAVSRSLGPVWIGAMSLIVTALAGPRVMWGRARSGGRRAALALGTIAAASATTVVWEARYQPGVPFDLAYFRSQILPASEQTERVLHELVGVFGALTVHLPNAAYRAWTLIAVVLVVLALVAGRGLDRLLLLSTLAGTVVAVVLLAAAVLRQNGFDVQGRHVLAFAVAAPLLAGEVLQRRWASLSPRLLNVATCTIAAIGGAVHLRAVLQAGRHYGWDKPPGTVGAWVPPGGVAVWVAVSFLAAAALVVGVTMASVGRSGDAGAERGDE